MSARDREQADLRSSIVQWCERRLPEKDSHRLMRTLKSDADARRLFAEYNALVALLELEIPTLLREQELPDAAPATRALGAELEDSEACGRWSNAHNISFPHTESPNLAPPPVVSPIVPSAPPSAPFVGEFVFSYMVATVFMCLLLLGFWAYKLPSDRGSSIASNENSRGRTVFGEDSPHDRPAPVFVGHITGIAGAKWSDEPNYIAPMGVRVALGRTYKIKSGLLEITYHSGAKVILEGPCTYKVESVAGGFLERGKLTARIIHQGPAASAAGAKPQAVFIVHTPTAVVTDLGTEFGVEVDENGDTTSYVFEGKIVVKAGIRGFGDSGIREVQLGAGESVMVGRVRETHHNSTKTETVHFTHPTTPPKFVLVFPRLKRNYLDLADIVAGGDGFGDARDRGIDAVNGRVVLSQPRDMSVLSGLHGDTRYHAVNELPFVDGVFIPDGGEGPVQITSAGHASSDFVDTNNRTWNLIWAGQIVTEYTPKRTVSCWLGNANYAGRRHSVLTMASNKGITFDLDAIRRKFPDVRLVRFTAVAGNTEMRSANPQAPRVSADLWVFVDGSLRFNKTDINSADDGFVVDIPLAPSERFLTLATTDAGNGHSFDWTIFGDPRLKIISKINDRTSGIHETQPSHAASGKEGAPIK